MEDYYSSYKEFRQEIDDACDCIHSYKCGTLNSEIVDIKNLISGLNVSDNWQDSVGDGISTIISACIDSLDDIIASITSSFETSESLYLELQRQLMNLETFNNDYQKRYGEKPDESDYHHTELVKGISYYLFGTKEYEDVFDKKKYEAALEKWEGDVERYSGLCEDLIEAIETNKKKLTEINEATISQETVSMISTSLSDFSDILSENENVRYKNLFITDGSPANNAAVIWNFFKYKGLNGFEKIKKGSL